MSRRGDDVVAVFPVQQTDEIVPVTDLGQVIRCPVHDIRIAGRGSQGVVVFRMAEGERVVSVAALRDAEGGDESEVADDTVAGDEPTEA